MCLLMGGMKNSPHPMSPAHTKPFRAIRLNTCLPCLAFTKIRSTSTCAEEKEEKAKVSHGGMSTPAVHLRRVETDVGDISRSGVLFHVPG